MSSKLMIATLLAAASGAACAQSDVSVWGRVGGGVEYLSGVSTGKAQVGSHWGTSILGFKGQEDLGGGLQALFWLEHAFSSDTGSQGGGRMWQRGSWVGLKSKDYGLLRLGNGNFINNYIWSYDPFLLQDYSASSFTNYRNGVKLPKGIRYESPSMNGFEFAAQLNSGTSLNSNTGPAIAGIVNTGKAWGLTAAYKGGDVEVRAIYNVIHNQNGAVDDLFVASEETFLGARYKLSASTTLKAGWSHYAAPDAAPGGSRKADHTWFGVQHDVGSAWNLMAAVYNMRLGEGSGSAGFKAGTGTMLEIGGMYNLSKRTFLYASAAHVHNSATSNFSVRPSSGRSPGVGQGQSGTYLGVMHNF